jgi:hypothetical protein
VRPFNLPDRFSLIRLTARIRLKLSGVIDFVSICDVVIVNINKIVVGCIIANFVESIVNIVGKVGVSIVARELENIQ